MSVMNTWVQRNQAMSLSLGNPIVADMFLQHRTETIEEPHVFQILELASAQIQISHLIERLCQSCDCSSESAASQVESLLEKGVLTAEDTSTDGLDAVRHWEERGWLEALVLHARTCDLRYSDERGTDAEPDIPPPESFNTQLPPDLRARGEIVEGEVVMLDGSATLPEDESIEEVLMRRRTDGPCRNDEVQLAELAALLRWANEKGRANRESTRQTFAQNPAALRIWSSFCCLETYVVAANVEGLKAGIYFYDVSRHELVLQNIGDFRERISQICIGQPWPKRASFSLMIACDWAGYQARYKHARAYRNLLINAGELAQRYLVAATALHLGNFITPALNDGLAAELFGLRDEKASAMYSLSFA